MFVSCDVLTQPEITRKMTWAFTEKLRRCNTNVLYYQRYYGLWFGAQLETVTAFLQNIAWKELTVLVF